MALHQAHQRSAALGVPSCLDRYRFLDPGMKPGSNSVKVRRGNIGALTMLIKMRPSSPKLAMVARELALRLVELSCPPDAVHPGSTAPRAFAPGGGGEVHQRLHPALVNTTQTTVPARTRSWYRTYAEEAA